MKMTIKLNIHDWPKRGHFMRGEVDVDAADDVEGLALGVMAGQEKWPHGKIKAYDVVRHPEPEKRKPGRPPMNKDAA